MGNNKVTPNKEEARLAHRRHSERKRAEGPSKKWQMNGVHKKQKGLPKIK